ncbi:MAG: IS21-like element helper ATPase IstB [Vicinamibacterales bacterium]|jgi:DNA replication protein DnaC|nr:IS21-like element helper ATPase IstB [Vicinamibacterales bacterium]
MDTYDEVRNLLDALRLRDALNVLDAALPDKGAKRVAALRFVQHLLREEVNRRTERRIDRRLRDARLPDRPTLETFDFDFQPTIDRDLVLELATLAWVDRREDLLLIGQSGVGKSHIGKALCLVACGQGRWVLYTTCADMLQDLYASLADDTLPHRLRRYTRPQLLMIDDLGYDPIEQEKAREAQLLYKVLEARHQNVSTIVASNLSVDLWPDYLGDRFLTVALLDRLLFHATTITIEGPSYRLAEHMKRNRRDVPPEEEPQLDK